jgi:hypothetical protein
MAKQYKPTYADNNYFDINFANVDFADFKPVDMNLLADNAQFAQEVANKRLDALMEERKKLVDEVKLNKRFDSVQQDLLSKLDSVISNAGNVQLSDNANYTKLNSNLIRIQTDPVLKNSIYTSEQAKKYSEILEKNPNLEKQPWNDPNYIAYQKFINGYTNDFEFKPIYKEVDYLPVWDEFFSKLPKNEQTAIVKYGANGIAQAKEEGFDKDQLIQKIQDYKQFVTNNNSDIKSNLERRGLWAQSQGLNSQEYIENFLNEGITASASKFAGVNRSITQPQVDVNKEFALRQQSENRIAASQKRQEDWMAPYEFIGGSLKKGSKNANQEDAKFFKNTIINNLDQNRINKGKIDGKQIDYNKSSIQSSGGNLVMNIVYSGVKKEGSVVIPIPSDVIFNAQQTLNNNLTSSNTSTTNTTNSGTNW